MNEHIHHEPVPGGAAQAPHEREGAVSGTIERAKETARESKEKLRTKAGEMKAKVSELGSQAKEKGEEVVERQKIRAAERIEGYSETVREASDRLEREHDPNLAYYTRMVAEKLEHAADYVRRSEIGDFRRDAEVMARRHPAVFYGGMFLAGLALARFVKASAEEVEDYGNENHETSTPGQASSGSEEVYASHPSAVI